MRRVLQFQMVLGCWNWWSWSKSVS